MQLSNCVMSGPTELLLLLLLLLLLGAVLTATRGHLILKPRRGEAINTAASYKQTP
jgi:hypothetical protein